LRVLQSDHEKYVADSIKLHQGIIPRGFSREQSARYIGVSSNLFDQLVGDGRMPQPKIINKRCVWDRYELDAAFEALPHKDEDQAADDDEWKVAL